MSYPTDNGNNFVNADMWNMDFLSEGAAPLPAGMQGELSFPGNANAYGLDHQQQQQQLFIPNPYATNLTMYDPNMPMLAQGQMQNYAPGPMPAFVPGPMPDYNAAGLMPGFNAGGAMPDFNAAGAMPNFAPGPMPDYAPDMMPGPMPGFQLPPLPGLADLCIDPALLLPPTLDTSGASTPSLGDVSTFTTASSSSLTTPTSSDAPATSLAAVDAMLKKVLKTGAKRTQRVALAGKPLKKHLKAPTRGKERIELAAAHAMTLAALAPDAPLVCPFDKCGYRSDTRSLHRRHILSHTKQSFPCSWCGRKLSRADAVGRHKTESCPNRHDPPHGASESEAEESSAEDSD